MASPVHQRDFLPAKLAKPVSRAILATPMLPFFIGLLNFLVVVDCLLLILIILMQRPRQDGLGAAFGSGVTDQMFGAQTTNVLQKFTTWLGIMLFLFTFVLAILVAKADNRSGGPKLVTDSDKKAAAAAAATPAPAPASTTSAAVPAPPETPKPAEAESKSAAETQAKPAENKPEAAAPVAPAPAPVAPAPAAPAPAVK
jgi:preprotein translocase subunit SecG